MKKFVRIIIALTLILSLCPLSTIVGGNQNNDENAIVTGFVTPSTVDSRNEVNKYLILNKDGSYGGSYNDALYGSGAPLNGEYDVENSDYYFNGDYYNMKSSTERKIFTKFSPYQQTMSSSCGVCSVNSALKYYGEYENTSYYDLELIYTNAYDYNPKFNDIVRNGTSRFNRCRLVRLLGRLSRRLQYVFSYTILPSICKRWHVVFISMLSNL